MIEIQLEDKIIKVKPELTIGQYQRIQKNMALYEKDPALLLSLYLDVPKNTLKDLPKKQMEFVSAYITSTLTEKTLDDELHNIFTYNDVAYGLENDFSKLSWGAWMDLEVFSAENTEDNIHMIMAILYRPITSYKNKKYIIEPYKADSVDERAELFREIPAKYWFGVASFFLLIVNLYISNLRSSLVWTNKFNKMMTKGWNALPKWVKGNRRLDSILVSPLTLPEKT